MATLKENMEAIKLEKDTKILPENLKSGITAFGVTGTFEGDGGSSEPSENYIPEHPVKIYSSVEELQADTDIVRDMVGLVYDYDGEPLKVDSTFNYATFPETVVLPEAITEYIDMTNNIVNTDESSPMYVSDCSLDESGFYFYLHYSQYLDIKVEYESYDGITYTRTDFTLDKIEENVGDLLSTYKIVNNWDNRFNYFINTGSSNLIGIYRAKGSDNFDIPTISEVFVNNGEVIVRRKNYTHFIDKTKLVSLIKSLYTEKYPSLSNFKCSIFMHQNKLICGFVLYQASGGSTYSYNMENNILSDGTIDGQSISSYTLADSVTFDKAYLYELDLENQTYTVIDTNQYTMETKSVTHTRANGTTYTSKFLATNIPTDTMLLCVETSDIYTSIAPCKIKTIDAVDEYSIPRSTYQSGNGVYEIAPTQLTLTDASKLAKGEIAYGNGQVIEGTFESTPGPLKRVNEPITLLDGGTYVTLSIEETGLMITAHDCTLTISNDAVLDNVRLYLFDENGKCVYSDIDSNDYNNAMIYVGEGKLDGTLTIAVPSITGTPVYWYIEYTASTSSV